MSGELRFGVASGWPSVPLLAQEVPAFGGEAAAGGEGAGAPAGGPPPRFLLLVEARGAGGPAPELALLASDGGGRHYGATMAVADLLDFERARGAPLDAPCVLLDIVADALAAHAAGGPACLKLHLPPAGGGGGGEAGGVRAHVELTPREGGLRGRPLLLPPAPLGALAALPAEEGGARLRAAAAALGRWGGGLAARCVGLEAQVRTLRSERDTTLAALRKATGGAHAGAGNGLQPAGSQAAAAAAAAAAAPGEAANAGGGGPSQSSQQATAPRAPLPFDFPEEILAAAAASAAAAFEGPAAKRACVAPRGRGRRGR